MATRAGPTVLVTTKSGSNNFHGSVFEFFRNTYLDARSYFASQKGAVQSESVWRIAGRSDQEGQDVLLHRLPGERTASRHSVQWAYSDDRDDEWRLQLRSIGRGASRLGPYHARTPANNADGFGNINSPYTFGPFQCDGSGNPIAPNADGSQNAGANCNKIPAAMFDPAVNPSVDPSGLAMMKLYPQTNAINKNTLTQLLECAGAER